MVSRKKTTHPLLPSIHPGGVKKKEMLERAHARKEFLKRLKILLFIYLFIITIYERTMHTTLESRSTLLVEYYLM